MTVPARAGGPGRRLTVILKASDRCNGACAYCSVGPAGRHTMTWAAFETLARELEQLAERLRLRELNLTFHGGEPTLLGERFVDRACRRLRSLPLHVSFLMQTNLLHLTPAMTDVVQRHGIVVGTSFDPLTGLRRDRSGRDAYQRWRASYLALAARGITPGAIFVVTRPALGRVRELFAAADELAAASGRRFGLQLNPIYGQGRADGDGELLITPEEFGEFLVAAWTLWEEGGRRHGLAPVRSLVDRIEQPHRRTTVSCAFGGACSSSHVGVDHALNVAGCGRRLDSKAFFGNLRERSLADILEQSEERQLLAGRSARLAAGECAACRFFGICHGGCPDDAALETGDLARPFQWCTSYRRLFEAITARRDERRAAQGAARASAAALPLPPTTVTTVRLVAPAAGDTDAAVTVPPGAETWLLATGAPGWLEYDGRLDRVAAAAAGPIRLWLPNRRVPALAMWQDVARRSGLRVALFEAAGLADALGALDALRASVWLDVAAIGVAAEGPAALAAALERFLGEARWKVPVAPYAEMLKAAVAGEPLPPVNRFGLTPGAFGLAGAPPPAADDAGALAPVLAALQREAAAGATGWRRAHSACARCTWRALCGGRLALDDGSCPPPLRRLAERLAAAADDIRTRLRGVPAARPRRTRGAPPSEIATADARRARPRR